jgi:hypothetical protein
VIIGWLMIGPVLFGTTSSNDRQPRRNPLEIVGEFTAPRTSHHAFAERPSISRWLARLSRGSVSALAFLLAC